MGSMPTEFPISLRSWPSKQNDPSSALPTLIQRINYERGGFRNLDEDGLRQEAAAEEAGTGEDDGGTSDEEEAATAEEPSERLKDLMKAREEMLGQIDQAHQAALFALDFVSLLQSKDQPVQASTTLSQFLRETVPMGTLGADKLQASRATEVQKLDNKRVAKGWKIQQLDKTVDSILASATRLENEIERETKYWEQVLAVSDAGWSLCKLPHEKHTLGVRFGFAEAAPAFKNRSLAALRRNPDGTVYLDQGISGNEPQALRVRIRTDSTETGSSTLPSALAEDAPIESVILQARNTIFSSELWQELNRETRSLASYGVRTKEDTIICPLTPTKTIVLDLIPLGDTSPLPSQSDDNIAEGICLALHLLLSCAHRQNHRRRTQPPPPISNQKRLPAPYNLLRPIISRTSHQSAATSVHSLFKPLCAVLESMKITPEPTYETISTPPPSSITSSLSASEIIVLSLTDRLESVTTFKISETTSIIIKSRTALFPVAGTGYFLSLSPESTLNTICKPPIHLDNWSRVEEYVLYATSCALASSFTQSQYLERPTGEADQVQDPVTDSWLPTIQANVLRKAVGDSEDEVGRSKQLFFHAERVDDVTKVQLKWEFMGEELGSGKAARGSGKDNAARKGEGIYEWMATGSGDLGHAKEETVRSLQDVVEEAGNA